MIRSLQQGAVAARRIVVVVRQRQREQKRWLAAAAASGGGGSGRIVVNKAPPPFSKKEVPTTRLIKSNVREHMAYLQSLTKLDPKQPPPEYFPDESGIVPRDLTEEMIRVEDMFDPRIHLANAPNWDEGYEEGTPLSAELIASIAVRARPMTIADYMRQALTHELYGYYTNPTDTTTDDDDEFWDDEKEEDDETNETTITTNLEDESSDNNETKNNNSTTIPTTTAADDDDDDDDEDLWDDDDVETNNSTTAEFIIGRRGDFVTAPEVSQVFGECLAVWYVTQWQKLRKPSAVQFVEVGPGKGTLMTDILRSCFVIGEMTPSVIRHVHLVEASPVMRDEQQRKLELLQKEQKDWNVNFVFHTTNDEDEEDVTNTKKKNDTTTTDSSSSQNSSSSSSSSIHVHWHATFSNFMSSSSNSHLPTFVVCQEFIDALPVHVFEKTKDGWRERMIDIAISEEEENKDTKEAKDKSNTIIKDTKETKKDEKKKKTKKTRLRVVLSTDASPACKTLLNINEDGTMEGDDTPIGQVCEVCPEGILFVQDVADYLEKKSNGGAALIIDYGGEEGSTDSLRGFSRHEQVDFLSRPGEIDVTADVDFTALRHAVNFSGKDKKHRAFGPTTQGQFLASMGIVERVTSLIQDEDTTEEQAEDLCTALERLIVPEQMGDRYKVLAISTKKDDIFEPPGF